MHHIHWIGYAIKTNPILLRHSENSESNESSTKNLTMVYSMACLFGHLKCCDGDHGIYKWETYCLTVYFTQARCLLLPTVHRHSVIRTGSWYSEIYSGPLHVIPSVAASGFELATSWPRVHHTNQYNMGNPRPWFVSTQRVCWCETANWLYTNAQ